MCEGKKIRNKCSALSKSNKFRTMCNKKAADEKGRRMNQHTFTGRKLAVVF